MNRRTRILFLLFGCFLLVGCKSESPGLIDSRAEMSDLKRQVAGVHERLKFIEQRVEKLELTTEVLKQEFADIRRNTNESAARTPIGDTESSKRVESRSSARDTITREEACARLDEVIRKMAVAAATLEPRDRGLKFHDLVTEVVAVKDAARRSIYARGWFDEDMKALADAIVDLLTRTSTRAQSVKADEWKNELERIRRYCPRPGS